MKKLTILDQIEKNYEARNKGKEYIDSIIEFSEKEEILRFSVNDVGVKNGTFVRLLDEGAILYGDGSVRAYIPKGAVEDYFVSLPDDFVGYVNFGHMDVNAMPFFAGSFTKDDLRLVDIGNDRKGLDVKLNLDRESILVKELVRQDLPIGLSVEMTASSVPFEDISEEEFPIEKNFPILFDLNIQGYSIVTNSANVASGDLRLKEALKMGFLDKKLKEATKEEKKTQEELATEKENIEVKQEEAEETVEKTDLESLAAAQAELVDELNSLKAENEDLKTKLANQTKADSEYLEKFAELKKNINEALENKSVTLSTAKQNQDDFYGEV